MSVRQSAQPFSCLLGCLFRFSFYFFCLLFKEFVLPVLMSKVFQWFKAAKHYTWRWLFCFCFYTSTAKHMLGELVRHSCTTHSCWHSGRYVTDMTTTDLTWYCFRSTASIHPGFIPWQPERCGSLLRQERDVLVRGRERGCWLQWKLSVCCWDDA